jgi:hypothetical protein
LKRVLVGKYDLIWTHHRPFCSDPRKLSAAGLSQ